MQQKTNAGAIKTKINSQNSIKRRTWISSIHSFPGKNSGLPEAETNNNRIGKGTLKLPSIFVTLKKAEL
jgi:hypothetical protein